MLALLRFAFEFFARQIELQFKLLLIECCLRHEDGMPDGGHHQAGLIAEDVGIDRDFAPRGDGETVMVRGGFEQLHAADDVMRIEEEDAHGQRVGIDRAAGEPFGFAGEEASWAAAPECPRRRRSWRRR